MEAWRKALLGTRPSQTTKPTNPIHKERFSLWAKFSLWARRATGAPAGAERGSWGPASEGVGGPRGRSPPGLARYAARSENFVLVVGQPHNGPGAPQARPPERSGDRGAPRAKAWGVRGGEAPRVWSECRGRGRIGRDRVDFDACVPRKARDLHGGPCRIRRFEVRAVHLVDLRKIVQIDHVDRRADDVGQGQSAGGEDGAQVGHDARPLRRNRAGDPRACR